VIQFLLALAVQSHPGVDDAKVDAAIKKGIGYLRKAPSPSVGFAKIDDSDELILLTFVHAGIPASDEKFAALLDKVSKRDLERTYEAALQAMIFEEIDRVKWQPRIAQCAQYLMDNQAANGQWSYGEPTIFAQEAPPAKDVASAGGRPPGAVDFGATKSKPKVVKKVSVRKQKPGPEKGDNSNSQYAALGLRACHDAGIVLPKEVLELARRWWHESRHPESGKDANAVASGDGGGSIRGWCYNRTDVCAKEHRPYGAMTAGAVGALAIYDYILGIDFKKDPAARGGLNWLAANWSVTTNPGPTELEGGDKSELFYYLYAVERTGMLYDTALIGNKDWYLEGAKVLLNSQKPDGSWDDSHFKKPTWDTCFSILFLKRATRRLTASQSAGSVK